MFTLEHVDFSMIDNSLINQFAMSTSAEHGIRNFEVIDMHVNGASIHCAKNYWAEEQVEIDFDPDDRRLELSCGCKLQKARMCEHQRACLEHIMDTEHLRAFFDEALRIEILRETAIPYGLEEEETLRISFSEFKDGAMVITPIQQGILPVNTSASVHKGLLPPYFQIGTY